MYFSDNGAKYRIFWFSKTYEKYLCIITFLYIFLNDTEYTPFRSVAHCYIRITINI